MSATITQSEFTLALSEEERGLLSRFLEQALRDKQVEVHRTDALDYKKYVEHQEALLRGVLDKLQR